MNDYLSKPFKESDLLSTIGHWVVGTGSSSDHSTPLLKEKTIDLSFLKSQVKNNKTFITEMITMFIQQTPKDIAALQQSIRENDFKAVYKTTHTLRNVIGYFGLTPLVGHELMQIEKISHTGRDMEEIQQLFNKIRGHFSQAVTELEQLDPSTAV